MDKRIFVKKRKGYDIETTELKENLNREFSLGLKNIEKYIVYDIFNIDKETYNLAKKSVFSLPVTDEVIEDINLVDNKYFAYEMNPVQYDQRKDSSEKCILLLNDKSKAKVRCGNLIIFDRKLTLEEMEKVKKFLVNPIDSRVKDMNILDDSLTFSTKPLKDLKGFITFSHENLIELKNELSLAMDLDDLIFIQKYFLNEKRDPTETEIYILDCYWSDHCRHTTFETNLSNIKIDSKLFKDEIYNAFNIYLDMKKILKNTKPVTLMDMATITGKYHKNILNDKNIEVSDEVNASSFFVDLVNEGKLEKWLIQFKNETHNHPTEIEPFGGASTCIGGAIRDPLSGRSYVYQAMRISGSGNILEKRENTLEHKLPQVDISTQSALGYSSYGNQIGLSTSYVKELYDDSYIAKHMEVGCVVGAVRSDLYKREKPKDGDIVVVIGGKTGKDGIQGASGSSLIHTNDSIEVSSSQVQKGNAIEERKIQRLFRNPNITKIIKKCNDFGAGGVCVAIGELSCGVSINLNKVLLKYEGLNQTEIATSESQERMAVVLDPKDYEFFISECEKENILYSNVATITSDNRLVMYFNDKKVVDLKRDFLDTNGIKKHTNVVIEDNKGIDPFKDVNVSRENILKELSSLNVTSQKGLCQMFDSSIGSTTVLMPFSGKNKLTPVQASVQMIPTKNTENDTATILTYGFIPKISHYSPFLSSIYASLESLAKVYAVGGNKDNLYFSYQEYFEKLSDDPKKWGKVTQMLLGTIYAQKEINRPSIGGKDSMSGTFNNLNVVETLISFSCSPVKIKNVITPHLKEKKNKLYYVPVVKDSKNYPNIKETIKNYEKVRKYIEEKNIVSCYVQEEGSVVSSLVKMSIGSGLGFRVNKENILNFDPASLIVESNIDLEFEEIGVVSDEIIINDIEFSKDEIYNAYTKTLNEIYPIYKNLDKGICENISVKKEKNKYFTDYIEDVKVLILAFPGTNCEYDIEKSFIKEKASTSIFVFRNTKEKDIEKSIDNLVKEIEKSHIIVLPGGFSSADEPDGSAKFIVNVLKNEKVKKAISKHLSDKKLILGICNGFQALIKSGLIPYGEIRDLTKDDLTLFKNDSLRHISTTVTTRVSNTNSPWMQDFEIGEVHEVLVSHGEGKLVGNDIEKFKNLCAFQYCDNFKNASLNGKFNPNGSMYAIEAMISYDGLILGKMGHSERYGKDLYKTNSINKEQNIFKNGVNYFKNNKN